MSRDSGTAGQTRMLARIECAGSFWRRGSLGTGNVQGVEGVEGFEV